MCSCIVLFTRIISSLLNDVSAEELAFMLFIKEGSVLNLRSETRQAFLWFSLVPLGKCLDSALN
jgi:hypothetical protein